MPSISTPGQLARKNFASSQELICEQWRRPSQRQREGAVGREDVAVPAAVGGGLIAVSPGKFGIGTFAPPLDAAGNSVRGQRAITDISNALDGNPYSVRPV